MKQAVVVTIIGTVYPGVSITELKQFCEEAVSTWGGQRPPDDPLFESMDVTSISARRIGKVEN